MKGCIFIQSNMKKIIFTILTIASIFLFKNNVTAIENLTSNSNEAIKDLNIEEVKSESASVFKVIDDGWVNDDGKWYYYKDSQKLKEMWIGSYYLDADGTMLTNSMTPDGYYVDSTGKYMTGRWIKDSVGWWYGFPNGYYVKDSWQKINGNDYYFNKSGYILTSTWKDDYYLNSTGEKLKNTMTPDGYYVDENGKYQKPSLVLTEKGKRYGYLNGNFVKDKWVKIEEDYYYFDSEGYALTSSWKGDYYLGADGIMYKNKITPDDYYTDSTGKWHREIIIKDEKGKKLWKRSKGFIKSGWEQFESNWYFVKDGYIQVDMWIASTYYVGSDGKMLVSTMTPDGYYLDKDGRWLHSAWDNSLGYWRYFDEYGSIVKGKWKLIDEKYYYFYPSGKLATNTVIEGKYYVDKSGVYIKDDDIRFYQFLPMTSVTPFTADELNTMVKNSRPNSILTTMGETFKKAERDYGVNALYLLCIAIIESNWGESYLAKNNYNFFGWQAYDIDSGNAKKFNTPQESILYVAEKIAKEYLSRDGRYFSGAFLGDTNTGMNKFYASDPSWGYTIAIQVRYFTRAYGKSN